MSVLGASCGVLGRLGGFLGRLEGVFRRGRLGASRGRLEGVLEASWGRLGGNLEHLGASWGVLDVQGVVLETSRGVCWPE